MVALAANLPTVTALPQLKNYCPLIKRFQVYLFTVSYVIGGKHFFLAESAGRVQAKLPCALCAFSVTSVVKKIRPPC
jgi:hypothetical protein